MILARDIDNSSAKYSDLFGTEMVTLSIIIVNWNVRDLLSNCLRSIFKHSAGLSLEIYVVDNNSSDGSVELLRRDFPNVKLIQNQENVGFARATNQGISKASGRYLLLQNPDTLWIDDSLHLMIDFMDKHPEIGVLGPKILNLDGKSTQYVGARRLPKPRDTFFEYMRLTLFFPKSRFFNRHLMVEWDHSDSREVECLSGCCLLIRRETIQEAGLLDEGYPLYQEDIDWCHRVTRSDWKLYYFADAQIIHIGRQSTIQNPGPSTVKAVYGFYRYYRKFYGSFAVLWIWFLIWTGTLVKLLACTVVFAFKGKSRNVVGKQIKAFSKILCLSPISAKSKNVSGNESKALKILIVHTALTPGGATRVAINDALSLKRQGFIVGVACEKRGALIDELKRAQMQLHRLYLVDSVRYSRWIRYMLGLPLSTILLFYIVCRNKYDCLYVHHRQSGIPSLVVSWLTGAKYVFISHTELGKLNKWRLFTPLGQQVIAVSEQVKKNITYYYHIAPDRVTVIPNVTVTNVIKADKISLHEFDKQWNIPSEQQVVACVAMLVEVKAHGILLHAWKQVLQCYPRVVLILVGDGHLKERLQAQCIELGIEQGVRFLGYVTDMSLVYSRASFLVLASRSEGLPLSILEGFSFGLPAIVTSISGMGEIVKPGKTGLLVEPNNPEALAQTIKHLLIDDKLGRQLGQNGRQLVMEKYSSGVREAALSNYFRNLDKNVLFSKVL